jgi:tetratricopeptide (TPR) repeat protein
MTAVSALALSLGACATSGPETSQTTSDASAFKVDLSRGDAEQEIYANYLSARFAATEHDLHDAAKYYRESLDRDPDNATLLALAFFYSTSSGEVDDAAKLAQRVVKATPDDRAARLTLAVAAMKAGNYADARANLNQSAKGPFTNLTASLVDAWAAAGAGDGASAIADLKAASASTGADALSAFHLGLLNEFLGHNAEADAAYRDALLKAGPSPRIVDAYGRFLERTGKTDEAAALYGKLAGDAALEPIIKERQADLAAHKKPDPLVSTPEAGAAEALFGIAGSLTEEASADIAILYLRLALYMRPDLALGDVLLGDRFEALQKFDDAIAAYRHVDHDSVYWRLAQIQTALDEARIDKTDDAIKDLKALTAADPKDLEAWTALGDAERAGEHWEDSAAAYDAAIKLLPTQEQKNWPLYYSRAISEEREHRWDLAEPDLQLALKLSPDQPEVLNYLGYSWVDQGRNIPDALKMLEKARQLRPQDGYIVDSVGWAYFKLGRFPDAAKTLQDAVTLVPGDPTINEHYGDALWRVGKKMDARFQWNHALAFGPDADQKTGLEKKLKDGLPG